MSDDLLPLTDEIRGAILEALEQGQSPPEIDVPFRKDTQALVRTSAVDANNEDKGSRLVGGSRRRIAFLRAALRKRLGPQFRAWLNQMLAEEML